MNNLKILIVLSYFLFIRSNDSTFILYVQTGEDCNGELYIKLLSGLLKIYIDFRFAFSSEPVRC